MRLIDADALYQETENIVQYVEDEIERAKHNPNEYSPKYIEGSVMQIMGMAHIQQCILDAPTVEPERKRGKWHTRIYSKVEMMVCSECQSEFSYDAETGVSDYNFCPNCGADMRGEG